MNIFSDKRRFVKSFCALSVAVMMAVSSLVSVTAAIAASSSAEEAKNAADQRIISPAVKTVMIDFNGKKKTTLFAGGTVAELLKSAGVTAGKNQITYPSLNTTINTNTMVIVRNAKPVKVTADGKTGLMVLACDTVEEALKLAGIPLGKDDIVSAKRSDKIENIDKLTIQRVTYKQITEKQPVAFEKVTENSDEVELGETKIGTEGKNGEKQVVKKVKFIDGKAVKETVVSEKVTKKPVNEVTLIGTKGVATTGGAGTFTDSNGVTVAYKEMFTGSGTAYTAPAGASTATGVPAYHGGVAIDPTIIPYGSKLYVESVDGSIVYGYCTAVDTGGFCDDGSGIIDVFYDTYDECVNWGRRDVNVYVIE